MLKTPNLCRIYNKEKKIQELSCNPKNVKMLHLIFAPLPKKIDKKITSIEKKRIILSETM